MQSDSALWRRPATRLERSASGRELAGAGYASDVSIAAEVNESRSVPVLEDIDI